MTDELTYYHMGVEVKLRGVEMAVEETDDVGPGPFTALYCHVQVPGHRTTTRVPEGALKAEGGLSAMREDMYERGMIPEWFYEGNSRPPEGG
jgi:hypothetical protein